MSRAFTTSRHTALDDTLVAAAAKWHIPELPHPSLVELHALAEIEPRPLLRIVAVHAGGFLAALAVCHVERAIIHGVQITAYRAFGTKLHDYSHLYADNAAALSCLMEQLRLDAVDCGADVVHLMNQIGPDLIEAIPACYRTISETALFDATHDGKGWQEILERKSIKRDWKKVAKLPGYRVETMVGAISRNEVEELAAMHQERWLFAGVESAFTNPRRIEEYLCHPANKVLTRVWLGSEMLCCHYGMIYDNVLLFHTPVINIKFLDLSPLKTLIAETVKFCAEKGLHQLDWGLGDESYKEYSRNSRRKVCEILVPLRLKGRGAHWLHRRVHAEVGNSLVRGCANTLKRMFNAVKSFNPVSGSDTKVFAQASREQAPVCLGTYHEYVVFRRCGQLPINREHYKKYRDGYCFVVPGEGSDCGSWVRIVEQSQRKHRLLGEACTAKVKRFAQDAKRPIAVVCDLGISGLGTVISLGRVGVPVIGICHTLRIEGALSRYCLPLACPNPETHESDYVDYLLELGQLLPSKAVLIPTSDVAVMLLSREKSKLRKYFHFPIAPHESVAALGNKDRFREELERLGLPHPRSYAPNTPEGLEIVSRKVEYPCIVKPVHSQRFCNQFHVKVFVARSRAELINAYQKSVDNGHEVIVQEFIPGPDENMYLVHGYFDRNSESLGMFSFRRVRQYPRGFGNGALCESMLVPELMELVHSFIKAVHYHGIIDAELKLDPRDGRFKFIEINPRPGWQIRLTTRCGINLPYLAYLDAIGEAPASGIQTVGQAKWLYWHCDMKSALEGMRKGELKFGAYIRSFGGPIECAVLALDDPMPFVFMSMQSAMAGLRKLGRGMRRIFRPSR